tara:strand:+ start:177 stop:563 length:387 start_codon:yes stop_codon:yes gene_type:complete
MSEKITVEIISPDKSVIKTQAIEAVIPSYEGEMGILKDHIPLITFLRPGLIKIINEDQKDFFVEDGTVEFSENNLLILTSTAKELSEINKNTLDVLLNQAEKKYNTPDISDKEKYLLSYKIEVLKSIE